VLTGSAHPRRAQIHSGAGRIVSLRMRPLSLAERQLVGATVRLADLFRGDALLQGHSEVTLSDYVREIVASGFPGIRTLTARGRERQLASYIENVIQREFPEQGYVV